MSMTGLRPKISARVPLSGMKAVADMAYAEPIYTRVNTKRRSEAKARTQGKSPSSSLSECAMVANAVDTAVSSNALKKMETRMAIKLSQKALLFVPVASMVPSPALAMGSLDEGACMVCSLLPTAEEVEDGRIANGWWGSGEGRRVE